jgi:hypothetical protein
MLGMGLTAPCVATDRHRMPPCRPPQSVTLPALRVPHGEPPAALMAVGRCAQCAPRPGLHWQGPPSLLACAARTADCSVDSAVAPGVADCGPSTGHTMTCLKAASGSTGRRAVGTRRASPSGSCPWQSLSERPLSSPPAIASNAPCDTAPTRLAHSKTRARWQVRAGPSPLLPAALAVVCMLLVIVQGSGPPAKGAWRCWLCCSGWMMAHW